MLSYSRFGFYIFIFIFLVVEYVSPQQQTVGVFINDTAKVWNGYLLLAPKLYTATYLINNQGRVINKWTKSQYPPGQSVYLLPNGHLLKSCMSHGQLSSGGGEGGRIEEYDWNDSLVWSFDYSTTEYMSHHDIRPLPNGNIIFLAVERKTMSQLIAAGFDTSKFQPEIRTKGYMLPDYVAEVHPTYPSGGTIVWEWHTFDHLIQDFDPTKPNYGVVANHPELIDADGDGRKLPSFWNHMNSITYNPKFDQILMSVRGNSEVWVIDHSTTTAQAAGHTGGKYGKGGDLLYRWGNPVCYKTGNSSTQKLFEQHDAEWVDSGYPGAGNITVFNNGVGRSYSTVDEFTPPVDSNGFYSLTAGTAFAPATFAWSYSATPPSSMYANAISGAQRLPNGNTIICDGTHGTLYEVTQTKEVAWKYICPVTNTGPVMQGTVIGQDPTHPGEYLNMVFRAQKYSPAHPGLLGRDLTPGPYLELYPTGTREVSAELPYEIKLLQNYPNPFNPTTVIGYSIPEKAFVQLKVYDILGRETATLVNEEKLSGKYEVKFDCTKQPSGIYLYVLKVGAYSNSKKLLVEK